jgi:L-lactate dehydrogenase complex protein LldG
MSARAEILGRIREAIGPEERAAVDVPREYRSQGEAGLELFFERLHHYDAGARSVAEPDLVPAIRNVLADHGVRRLVAPEGIADAWLEPVEVVRDTPPLEPHRLDGVDGVISTCALAIAPTGTIVLDGSAGMGRRALSLVPDFHLCVVRSEQIVGSVPQAIARLEPTRPLTFISGPSATVDIEMVRVKGVHGPRRLEVIVVG